MEHGLWFFPRIPADKFNFLFDLTDDIFGGTYIVVSKRAPRRTPPSDHKSRNEHILTWMRRLSGVQKQVLSLYISFIRTAKKKPPSERLRWESIIRDSFKTGAETKRNDFKKIEYMLRQGNKKLEMFENSSVKSMRSV
ncbi:hypothetical protein AAMO2058_001169100 [Amorphochlora amoebiformis]